MDNKFFRQNGENGNTATETDLDKIYYAGDTRGVLFFDIETMPNDAMLLHLDEVTPPKNYKDQDKIDLYVQEKLDQQYAKMAVDIDFARIVAISWAQGFESPPEVIVSLDPADEVWLVKEFWHILRNFYGKLIGFNILDFDLPILIRRAMVYQVSTQRPMGINLSPYNDNIIDFMQRLWHRGHAPGPMMRSMKKFCEMYDIPNDLPDVDGSLVATMSKEELEEYVANDVKLLQAIGAKTFGYYW